MAKHKAIKLSFSPKTALMDYSVEIDKFPQLLSYFNFYMGVASSYHFLLNFIDCIKGSMLLDNAQQMMSFFV